MKLWIEAGEQTPELEAVPATLEAAGLAGPSQVLTPPLHDRGCRITPADPDDAYLYEYTPISTAPPHTSVYEYKVLSKIR